MILMIFPFQNQKSRSRTIITYGMKKQIHFSVLAFLFFLVFNSCNNSNSNQNSEQTAGLDTATIKQRSFGNYYNFPVTEYTLRNIQGMQVSILDYGGTISKLMV